MDSRAGQSNLALSLDDIIKKKSIAPIQIHNKSFDIKKKYLSTISPSSINQKRVNNCRKGRINEYHISNNLERRIPLKVTNKPINCVGNNKKPYVDLRNLIQNNNRFKPPSSQYIHRNNQPSRVNYYHQPYSTNGEYHNPDNQKWNNNNNMNSFALSEAAQLLHESFNGLSHLAQVILDSNEKIRSDFRNNIQSTYNQYPMSNPPNDNIMMRTNNSMNESYHFYSHHPYYVKKRNIDTDSNENNNSLSGVTNENNFHNTPNNISSSSNNNNNNNINQINTRTYDSIADKPSRYKNSGYGILLEHSPTCRISVPDITDLLSPIGALTHIEKLDQSSMLIFFEKEQEAHYAVCQYNQKYLDGSPLTLTLIKK